MSGGTRRQAEGPGQAFSCMFELTTHVEDGETEIEVSGTRDVAIVVRSASGERVYLPPEGFRESVEESPYRSSYGRGDVTETPYRGTDSSTRGVVTTPDGFLVYHAEPVTEIDVYRDGE